MASYTAYPATSSLNVYRQQSAPSFSSSTVEPRDHLSNLLATSLTLQTCPSASLLTGQNIRDSISATFELDYLELRRGETKIRRICEIEDGVELCLENYPDINPMKPPVSRLLLLAIWQSPHKRLSLQGIYEAILARNTLSRKVGFKKLQPPGDTGRGYGCEWAFVLSRDEDVAGPLRDHARRASKNKKSTTSKRSKAGVTRKAPGVRKFEPGSLLRGEWNPPTLFTVPPCLLRPPNASAVRLNRAFTLTTSTTSEWCASGLSVSESYEFYQPYLGQGYSTHAPFPPYGYYANDFSVACGNQDYYLPPLSYP
ncbi:hypothetical protein CVT24_008218 [Panaeolus cyanescens]|uniref:Fork-head domain-containing protein n=1 Tax=Panaeolus cyanescens TaxID=181874 RepID=A0A409VF29_9AGAR|nr:hypothetical protein CVT24_008218 [Panaeolus cyanescens]